MQAGLWSGVDAVVFDLDGTLLNTEAVIVHAASQALQAWGHAALPPDYRMPNMHGTAAELMADVLKERGHALPEGGMQTAGDMFEHCYAQYPAHAIPLYDGVVDFLQSLRHAGLCLGVCTNKVHALALQGLEAAGILTLFEVVTGRDSCGVAKPAAAPLLHTLAQLNRPAERAIFVGDTHVDAACAQAAGVRFAWFSAGFGDQRVQDYAQVVQFASYVDMSAALLEATAAQVG